MDEQNSTIPISRQSKKSIDHLWLVDQLLIRFPGSNAADIASLVEGLAENYANPLPPEEPKIGVNKAQGPYDPEFFPQIEKTLKLNS